MKKVLLIMALILLALYFVPWQKVEVLATLSVGDPVDSLHGVVVYYNGSVGNVSERNVSKDGYNLGLKYQCVEFVKRYYYERLNHKMPDSYGHAKDFFDHALADGEINKRRNLVQFTNPSKSKPEPDDLLVYAESKHNSYGHVAIIARVEGHEIEIIQQNPGAFNSSRARFQLINKNGTWKIANDRILGWLRKV
jgi:surface antigen